MALAEDLERQLSEIEQQVEPLAADCREIADALSRERTASGRSAGDGCAGRSGTPGPATRDARRPDVRVKLPVHEAI